MAADQIPTTPTDNTLALQSPAAAASGDSLRSLQQDSGIFAPAGRGDQTHLTDAARHIGIGLDEPLVVGGKGGDSGKDIDLKQFERLFNTTPSDKERADAEKALEGRMSKLIPEADRQAMKDMTTALTNGDSKAFAEAVKKAGNDPEKLKALADEVNKNLQEKGSSTRVDVSADGKVIVSDGSHDTAVSFDPKTGAIESKSIEHNMDGSILVKPGELLNSDADKTFKEIGDDTVNAVNGKNHHVVKLDPFSPENPFEPHHPFKPWGTVPIKPWTEDPEIIWDNRPQIKDRDPGFLVNPKNGSSITPQGGDLIFR